MYQQSITSQMQITPIIIRKLQGGGACEGQTSGVGGVRVPEG
jgi:hypothetical protein